MSNKLVERIRTIMAEQQQHGDPAACLDYSDVQALIAEIGRLQVSASEAHSAHRDCIDMLGKANQRLAAHGLGPLAVGD